MFEAASPFTDLLLANGLLYLGSGPVLNGETLGPFGTLQGIGAQPLLAINSKNTRLYILSQTAGTSRLDIFDPTTLVRLGQMALPQVRGTPSSLVACADECVSLLTSAGQWIVVQTPQRSDLALSNELPAFVTQGDQLVAQFTVTNNGPWPVRDIQLEFALPAEITYSSLSATNGACAITNGALSCLVPSLDVTAQATIQIGSAPTQLGFVTNTVTLIQAGSDPDPGNDQTVAVVEVVPEAVIVADDLEVTEAGGVGVSAVLHVKLSRPSSHLVQFDYTWGRRNRDRGQRLCAPFRSFDLSAGSDRSTRCAHDN